MPVGIPKAIEGLSLMVKEFFHWWRTSPDRHKAVDEIKRNRNERIALETGEDLIRWLESTFVPFVSTRIVLKKKTDKSLWNRYVNEINKKATRFFKYE